MGRSSEPVGTVWRWEDERHRVEVCLERRDALGYERWSWEIFDKEKKQVKADWDNQYERAVATVKTRLYLLRPDRPKITLRKQAK